jgi:hypothetical protein
MTPLHFSNLNFQAIHEYRIPTEITLLILEFLPKESLGTAQSVCREWNLLISSELLFDNEAIKREIPELEIFDKDDWKDCVDFTSLDFTVQQAPKLNQSEIKDLKDFVKASKVATKSKVTLLTIPKGLTLNKLISIAEQFKCGQVELKIWNRAIQELGNLAVNKTYRVAMTNSIVHNTVGLNIKQQEVVLRNMGCKIPEALPATALNVLKYKKSPQAMTFDIKNQTLTRQQVDDQALVVGQLPFSGFSVTPSAVFAFYLGSLASKDF